MEKNPKATMKEIEHVLDGNLCRCTGYRPIHDAFKSFASDASESLLKTVTDIEDAGNHENYVYDSSLISCVPNNILQEVVPEKEKPYVLEQENPVAEVNPLSSISTLKMVIGICLKVWQSCCQYWKVYLMELNTGW